ncbi:hypothetical protein LguiB_010892 [Lonicera macranthoides]
MIIALLMNLYPGSFRFIFSCIKIVSSNVRSAGATIADSISGESDEHHKDQVGFDFKIICYFIN